jgi:hypothetical protein
LICVAVLIDQGATDIREIASLLIMMQICMEEATACMPAGTLRETVLKHARVTMFSSEMFVNYAAQH